MSAIAVYDMHDATPSEPAIAVRTAITTLRNLPQSKEADAERIAILQKRVRGYRLSG